MPVPCPACDRPTPRLLGESSKGAVVNYYRCDCGHVWTATKTDGSFCRHVTPLTRVEKKSTRSG